MANNNNRNRVNQTENRQVTPSAKDNIAPSVPQQTPQDINSPTVTGFTAEDTGLVNAKEANGLRTIDMDEATNLRQALSNIIGYQTGSTYRHDFESGVETLRSFGFGYNTDRADADATRVQEETMANERGELDPEQNKDETNKADAPAEKTDTDAK